MDEKLADDDEQQIWPDVPRTVFGSDGDPMLNACVGWTLSSGSFARHGYQEGYARAASLLLDQARARKLSPEYAIWPIAFLWRHHIELCLKEIIDVGGGIIDQPSKVPSTHDLDVLWVRAREVILRIGSDDEALAHVAANIDEVMRLDPKGDGFRYPTERDQRTASLKNVPEYVNLEQLDLAMRAVSSFLTAACSAIDAEMDARSGSY